MLLLSRDFYSFVGLELPTTGHSSRCGLPVTIISLPSLCGLSLRSILGLQPIESMDLLTNCDQRLSEWALNYSGFFDFFAFDCQLLMMFGLFLTSFQQTLTNAIIKKLDDAVDDINSFLFISFISSDEDQFGKNPTDHLTFECW